MRLWQIWFLGIIMSVASGVLLWLQVDYFNTMVAMRNQQFSEAVSRSLYQVSVSLQKEETRRFLEADMLRPAASSSMNNVKGGGTQVADEDYFYYQQTYSKIVTDSDGKVTVEEYEHNVSSPNVYISSKHGKNNLLATSKKLQNQLKERYLYQKELLDAVILDILESSERMNILERIDFKQLREMLRSELANNGIQIPFEFSIANSRNQSEYFSSSRMMNNTKDELYSQTLFPNNKSGQIYSLNVIFPEKRSYIFETLQFMIPSFIFIIVLMVLVPLTIWQLFRQKRVNEMRTDFINNMTHEFKTPVSTISLAAQMLKEPSVGSSPAMMKHISRVIGDETKRLSFQVEKVLQMSMFDREKAALKRQTLDMNKIIEGVVDTFRLKVEAQEGGVLEAHLNATNALVKADEMHITNVLFNLMDNAVKYSKPEESIHLSISTKNEGDRLVIVIEDNGIGMPKEHLRKIFERFYRVPKGNVHNVKGFGLGLAYVKKIVDDHGGRIKAESELGKGSRFIIILETVSE